MYYAWPKEKAELVKRRYLNAVYNVDRRLRSWAQRLQALGVRDHAIVATAGDNGEVFYKHGLGVSVLRKMSLRNGVFLHVHASVVQDAVIDWPWKQVYTRSPPGKVEFYNLKDDPEELRDLAENRKEIAVTLR